ncbi:MAG: pilus assembly protein [Rhizobiaceae bacterium]|nr:pilus assembly protein [Rhizobiaceae bacterium]
MALKLARAAGNRLADACRRLAKAKGGVAAVEFAFIAPVLLSLYFVTMEVSQAIEVNKKVGRVGSMVADLITQQQSTTKSEVDAILKIGESILQPYNRTDGRIVATAIQITDEENPKVIVAWSRKLENGTAGAGLAKNSTTTVPADLKIRNTFLIRVESDLSYKPVITWAADQKQVLGLAAAFDGIAMGERYYLRPRMSQTIPCPDC